MWALHWPFLVLSCQLKCPSHLQTYQKTNAYLRFHPIPPSPFSYLSRLHFFKFLSLRGPSGSNGFHPESTDAWLISSTTGVSFSDIAQAAPLDAIQMVPDQGWFQIFLVAGWFECIAYNRQWAEGREVPGDYGFDPLGFTKKEGGIAGKGFESLRMREIKNGRMAM